ncbi:MAG TPA: hypothetical protein VG652_05380 [Gaiellaceae bacterium]|nr:hypothetical protein [Gaiellaceae bacterium]
MTMSRLRRILFPIRLAAARLGSGGGRLALVALGIVAGTAALGAVLGGRLVMQDRALAQATAALPSGNRSLEVAWVGDFGPTWRALDRQVVPAMDKLAGRKPIATMLYRESQINGRLVNLRAVNGLAPYVHLDAGRLPKTCVPSHCEVLRIAGVGPVPSKSTIRLIQVGRATLDPAAPFKPFIQPAESGIVSAAVQYHTAQPSPVLLADGVDGLSRTSELATFFRAYAWFVPVEAGDVHPWSVGAYTQKVDRLRAQMSADSGQYEVTAPTDQLTAAVTSSRVAARRLLLLGGEVGTLLLAFTILAAGALRREITAARQRLAFSGARRSQIELQTFVETGAVAVAATIVGWAIGALVAAGVASRAGSPAWPVVEHALLSATGLTTAAAAAATAAVLLYLAVRAPALQAGRLTVTPLDVAALAAIGAVVLGYARGSVDTQSLAASKGTGVFVLLVPGLVTFAAAICAVRLLVPTLRALGRIGRRGPIALRLAVVSLARNPGGAATVATFLVASLGLALFAVTYRSTLLQGQRDEAAYAAPAPYVLDENLSQLVPVLHAWKGGPATQIVRLSGNVPSSASFTFLGVPPTALAQTGGWRSDFASTSLAALAKRLAPKTSTALHSTALPAGKTFALPVSTNGDDISVRAFFRSPLGDFDSVILGPTDGSKRIVLHGRIPFTGATLTSLELDLISPRLTANGGTGTQPTARGVLHLGVPSVDGKPVTNAFADWLGVQGASIQSTGIAYSTTAGDTTVIRPRQPTDGNPIPVLATPAIAAAAGNNRIVPLTIEGEQIVGHIVGILHRFPSIAGDAIIADRQTAETALDTSSPGLGTTNELWVDSLGQPAPSTLTVISRAQVLAGLRADPLARGALITLASAAALALALALIGLLLGVAGDRRDERGELFDLEAQGAAPATIRTHLRLRALLVACFGLIGGAITGAILSSLVLSLVSVTASAALPEPPLRLVLDGRLLAGAIVAYAVLAAVLVYAATALHERAPARAAEAAA